MTKEEIKELMNSRGYELSSISGSGREFNFCKWLDNHFNNDIPRGVPYHMYILSNEKINYNDWCMYPDGKIIQYLVELNTDNLKKIIATTDKSIQIECDECKAWKNRDNVLYTCSCQKFPQPSELYLKYFINKSNEDGLIQKALVEYKNVNNNWQKLANQNNIGNTIIPDKFEVFVNSKNEIYIKI